MAYARAHGARTQRAQNAAAWREARGGALPVPRGHGKAANVPRLALQRADRPVARTVLEGLAQRVEQWDEQCDDEHCHGGQSDGENNESLDRGGA